mgnify:CR=1 FL=1
MILGYSMFHGKDNLVYKTNVYHPSYNKLELKNMTVDELYIDEDIAIPFTIDKPNGWNYRTVIDSKFNNSLEGGSVQANNFQIERVRFQRRLTDEVEWQDVGEIEYNPDEKLLYEVIDKNIQNDFEYQYSILPITATVLGNRVVSDEIVSEFEGIFLSDKDNNYRLFYNIEPDSMQHNISTAILETLNSQYPIIVDGNLDYRSGGIKALFVSTETASRNDGKVTIRAEKVGRDRLMKFLKNRKPKVLRQPNGETLLVRIVGKPQEEYLSNITGIAYVNFQFVEIGSMDSETLKTNDILIGLEEEF